MKPLYVAVAISSLFALHQPKIVRIGNHSAHAETLVLEAQVSRGAVLQKQSWSYSANFPVHNVKTIERLIQCESQGVNISRPDSDGKISDGILQFHRDGTWQDMEKKSGIEGDPRIPEDAIRMADWMIDNGYIGRWSCAHILHLTN